MRVRYFLVMMSCLSLLACGGGGSDDGGSGGSASGGTSGSSVGSGQGSGNSSGTSSNEDGFAGLEVADDFNWQMDERADLSFELVSTVSQGMSANNRGVYGANWLSISGQYVVQVFAIDGDGNVLTDAVFTGMTNQYGQLAVNFNLMDEWLGVVVDVDLGEQSCSQSVYKDELTSLVQLGCDLAVGSDL